MNKNKCCSTTYIIKIHMVQKQIHVLGQILNLKNMMCLDAIGYFKIILEAKPKPKSCILLDRCSKGNQRKFNL